MNRLMLSRQNRSEQRNQIVTMLLLVATFINGGPPMLFHSACSVQHLLLIGLGLACIGCIGGTSISASMSSGSGSLQAPMTSSGDPSASASPDPSATVAPSPSTSEAPPAPAPANSAGSTTPVTMPVPSCSTANLAVCDDFEIEAVGAAPSTKLWRINTTNKEETITIDDSRSYSGKQSLHIHTTNKGFERAEIVNTSMFPAPQNTFFGRAFLYLDSDVPQVHCNIVRAGGLRPGETQQTSYNIGTQFQLMIDGYYNASTPGKIIDEAKHAAVQERGVWKDATYMPSRRWTCLEWQFDGAGNNLHVWLDGTAITLLDTIGGAPALSTERPWIAPPFSEVALGWTVIANSENFDHFDLWLDAVAFDGSRIGCDR